MITSEFKILNIVVETKQQAESVLARLRLELLAGHRARVDLFYNLVDLAGNYNDTKFAWEDLSDAEVVEDPQGGWGFKLSQPVRIHN